jgi:hypothetical protein
MALDFQVKDIIHRIAVKFTHAFLPDAKKPYYARAKLQPVLDIHELASKADVYNISTPPKTIEDGLKAAIELIFYLVADGYRIKTDLFNINIRVPGEYVGSETHLAEGVHPQARLQTSAEFRQYLADHVTVVFDGIDDNDGSIDELIDEATGIVDEAITLGNLLTLHGYGLKIEGDATHHMDVGLYFINRLSRVRTKAEIVAVNEPRTLKVIVPTGYEMAAGLEYLLELHTQSSARNSGNMLKEIRVIRPDFILTAQA